MSYNNPITVKRHQKALAAMIVDTMRNENKNLLEAYITVSRMATSDEVIALAKAEVAKRNGVEAQ